MRTITLNLPITLTTNIRLTPEQIQQLQDNLAEAIIQASDNGLLTEDVFTGEEDGSYDLSIG